MSEDASADHIKIELLLPGPDLEANSDEIRGILQSSDQEFVPALSARESTTDSDLSQKTVSEKTVSYFETLMQQPNIVCRIDSKIAGLLSFIPHYQTDFLQPWSPSTYASTTIVLPQYRRRGLGHMLNEALENLPEALASPFITRRTWSTNKANLSLLVERGFQEVARLKDDRGPGIDTIYLARRTHPDQTLIP